MKHPRELVLAVVAVASLLVAPPAIADDHGDAAETTSQTASANGETTPAEPPADPQEGNAEPPKDEGMTEPKSDATESAPAVQPENNPEEGDLDELAPPLPARADEGIVQVHGPIVKVREFTLAGGTPAANLFPIGNWDGQGLEDYARVEADGTLTLVPRQTEDALSSGRRIGVGWTIMRSILGGADFNGDGAFDLVAIDHSNVMYLYQGNGRAGFGHKSRIGVGWGIFPLVRMLPQGPGKEPAILAENGEGAFVYSTNGYGSWESKQAGRFPSLEKAVAVPDLWKTGYSTLAHVATDTRINLYSSDDGKEYDSSGYLTFSQPLSKIVGAVPGSTAGTTVLDVLMKDGSLFSVVIKGDGNGEEPVPEPEPQPQIPPLWNAVLFSHSAHSGVGWPSDHVYSMGDFNGDKQPDAAIMWPDGRLVLYPSQGDNRFGVPVQIGAGWTSLRDFHTGVDFNGDGRPDIVARAHDGSLLLYPGNGRGGFEDKRKIGVGWGMFDRIFVMRQGPNGHPIVYGLSGSALRAYSTNGRAGFVDASPVNGDHSWMRIAYVSDDWTNSGLSDLLYRDEQGLLWVAPQNASLGFSTAKVHRIGNGWGSFTPILPVSFDAANKVVWTVDASRNLRTYYFRHTAAQGAFVGPKAPAQPPAQPSKPRTQSKSFKDGPWLRHPVVWKGQPDDETCGPTSMWMVLNYLDAHRSAYDGKPLDVWTLKGRDYANVGTGFSGGTSWEESRLSMGMNRWLGKNVYKQWTFPSGWDFRFKVIDSFKTGRPVVVDTIENYGGPHYNGHVGRSSHIIVAHEYHAHDGAIGFVDPGGPGSAISGYSAQRYFRYPSAIQFGTNFLGNYGGGGHGMVY